MVEQHPTCNSRHAYAAWLLDVELRVDLRPELVELL